MYHKVTQIKRQLLAVTCDQFIHLRYSMINRLVNESFIAIPPSIQDGIVRFKPLPNLVF